VATPVAAEVVHPQIVDYRRWLAVHRGLSDRSVSRQCHMIKRLLSALGEDPQAYSAATIRAAFRDEAQRCSPSQTRTTTSALRGFLRFLAASGLCRPGLDQAVPPVLQWRLSTLPRDLRSVLRRLPVVLGCNVRAWEVVPPMLPSAGYTHAHVPSHGAAPASLNKIKAV
jgi:hypothetical protein